MPSLTRRDMLLAAAGTTASFTGCSTTDNSSAVKSSETPVTQSPTTRTPVTSSSPSPTADPQPTPGTPIEDGQADPAPSCRDGYHPLRPNWVVHGPGPLGGFELRIEPSSIAFGDTITATLRNVSGERKGTGTKVQYDVQYQTESGWHSIFGTDIEGNLVRDLEIPHEPGEGFTWEMPVTRDGWTGDVDEEGSRYDVCDALDPGTYRFVYWGVTGETRDKKGYALGVPFSVSRG